MLAEGGAAGARFTVGFVEEEAEVEEALADEPAHASTFDRSAAFAAVTLGGVDFPQRSSTT